MQEPEILDNDLSTNVPECISPSFGVSNLREEIGGYEWDGKYNTDKDAEVSKAVTKLDASERDHSLVALRYPAPIESNLAPHYDEVRFRY